MGPPLVRTERRRASLLAWCAFPFVPLLILLAGLFLIMMWLIEISLRLLLMAIQALTGRRYRFLDPPHDHE
jgi:hypothetical protein